MLDWVPEFFTIILLTDFKVSWMNIPCINLQLDREKTCKFYSFLNREAATRGVLLKDVLENITKFTGKHPCPSLFFNKAAGLRPGDLLKRRHAQLIPCEISDIFKNTFFTEQIWTTTSKSWKFFFLGAIYMRWDISPRWGVSSKWDTFHSAFTWEKYPTLVKHFSSQLASIVILI